MGLSRAILNENNPEILKELLKHASEFNEKLLKELGDLRAQHEVAMQTTLGLDDKLCTLQKRMFGKSSEKLKSDSANRVKKDELKTIHSNSLAPEPSKKELEKLPEVSVDKKLDAVDLSKIAIEYGYPEDSKWEEVNGFYDESDFVDIKVESYVRKKVRRFKYRLIASKKTEKEIIVTAPKAIKILPGSKYGIDLAVEVAVKKYVYHLPLERISRIMESGGLTLAVNTLYSLSSFVSFYLEGIVEEIKKEILSHNLCMHLDETPWPINNKVQDDGYMWVMSNAGGSYYQFEPTRSGDIAKELLGSYTGPILTDGFSGYKKHFKDSDKVLMSYCWSHARRKFVDVQKNYPKEVKKVLKLLTKLFRVEHKVKNLNELKILREKESALLVKELETLLIELKVRARSESGLLKAINYSMNHWFGLTRFLEDARIPLTNNEAERSIRHSVMGRKNFYGSRSINGADVASVFYTVIETCKKVELDPKSYILMAVKKKAEDKNAKVPTPLQYAKEIRSTITA